MKRTINVLLILLVVVFFSLTSGYAEDKDVPTLGDWGVAWTGGMGISYPLIVQLSTTITIPIVPKEKDTPYGFPGVPAAQASLDLGLGGGLLAGGIALPMKLGYSGSAINLKAALLRTWLWSGAEDVNTTYQGVIGELVIPSHPSGKIGVGYFRDPYLFTKGQHELFYVFFGIGL